MSRAFRHVAIDPMDLDLLGLSWEGDAFIDTKLPFGSRHGMQIFQRLMRRHGFTVINCVDDFIGVATPSIAQRSYDFLLKLLADLGLEVSVKKLVPPTSKAICLGVEIDTEKRTISIPAEKLNGINCMVYKWLDTKICSKRNLQSLLGNLLYVAKCVKPARTFLNRMLQLLRDNYDKARIKLTHEFRRDLRWFHRFLAKYNGVSFYDHVQVHQTMELDACLTGLGGRCQNKVYHLKIPEHFKNLGIVQLEMVNILVALRLYGCMWQHKRILIKCDNMAVVQVLRTGKTRDPFLATCARNVWMVTADLDIDIVYTHVHGVENMTADLLSRWQNTQKHVTLLTRLVGNWVWLITDETLLKLDYEI